MTTAALLEVRQLRFAWPGEPADILALEGFALAAGRRLFVHGPSGCGKSTLLGLLAGVLVARAGEVRLLGHDWARLPAAARDARRADHVGVIFQQFNLLPYLSALDNVLLPCRFSRRRAERASAAGAGDGAAGAGDPMAAARRLLQRVALPEALWSRPARLLSVGQQQRVAAARALIGAPELIIADEPTSALDAALRDEFMALLLGECAASGASLVFVSHDERLAAAFDERLDLPQANHALLSALRSTLPSALPSSEAGA
ncbi:MAG: ATP-binding cassette domain-containing protein [Burkholderiales bacterium]|nr:ATP-binding cassette domain-containing protein [Burkholderiales bacterium]